MIGAVVELVDLHDDTLDEGPRKVFKVLVNGTDVGVMAEDGVRINVPHPTKDEAVTVTLVLMPRLITVRPSEPGVIADRNDHAPKGSR